MFHYTKKKKNRIEYTPIKEALDTMGKWYVENVYTYLAGNYGAERDSNDNLKMTNDYYNTSEVGEVRVEKNWHFPVNDEEYKENFIKRFKDKYEKVNEETVKKKREDNIKSKGENKNYLDTIQGSEIDKKWSENELCGRSNRGATKIVGGETAKISQVDPITKKAKELEIITATKSVIIGGNQRGSYECDLLNDKKVGDDCTAFASAVICKFIKDNQIGDYANYSYLNSWGSSHFTETEETLKNRSDADSMPLNVLKKYGFKQYTADMIKKINKENTFELQFGDLLCRKGHVEFYKGETNSNSFGWGDVHSTYDKNSGITYTANADGTFKGSESSELYTVIYRFEGLN